MLKTTLIVLLSYSLANLILISLGFGIFSPFMFFGYLGSVLIFESWRKKRAEVQVGK